MLKWVGFTILVAPGRKLKEVEAGKGALSFLTRLCHFASSQSVNRQARPEFLDVFADDFTCTLPFNLPLPAVAS